MKENQYLKDIGANIKIARLKKGLTQEDLAEKCNVSSKYISALERGITSGSIPLIINICNTLDVTPNYIFEKSVNIKDNQDIVDIIDNEVLINYAKLKDENKKFINMSIEHLYNMQNKR